MDRGPLKSNPDPEIPLRFPRSAVRALATVFPPDGPFRSLVEGLHLHATSSVGRALVGWARQSEVLAAYAEVEAVTIELGRRMAQNGSTSRVFSELTLLLQWIALTAPVPESSIRWILFRGWNAATTAQVRMENHLSRSSRVSTNTFIALRGLEEAELLPSVWRTQAWMRAMGGVRSAGIPSAPGFAWLIAPCPLDLLPTPTTDPDEALASMRSALAEIPYLDRLELVACRVGGPAAAARGWCCDFLAQCVTGLDTDPVSAAEARATAHRAWVEVVVPAAVVLQRSLGDDHLHHWPTDEEVFKVTATDGGRWASSADYELIREIAGAT